jgi:hypothetical protein
VLLHLARERVEVARALVAGQAAPGGEGAPRGLDRRTTSSGDACAMRASFWPVAGLMLSKCSRPGAKAPPMKWPKIRPWLSSHSTAGPAASGAGPYSIDSKISATFIPVPPPTPSGAGERPSSGR